MANSPIVYQVTNTVNGKRYIGVTRFTVEKRWAEHKYGAASGRRTWLYAAMRKHGVANFVVAPLASCLDNPVETESLLIQQESPEYNQTNGGEWTLGRTHTPEERVRISERSKGRKWSPEKKAAMSATKKEFYAANPAALENAKANIRKALSMIDHKKRRAAHLLAMSGRQWAEESRIKLSASCTGRVYGKDIIEKVAAKHRKPVECVTLGIKFPSALHAAEALGIHNSAIGKACGGRLKTAGGYVFRFTGGPH